MSQPRSSRPIKTSKPPVADGPTFDQIIDEVHAIREQLLAESGNDLRRYASLLNRESRRKTAKSTPKGRRPKRVA